MKSAVILVGLLAHNAAAWTVPAAHALKMTRSSLPIRGDCSHLSVHRSRRNFASRLNMNFLGFDLSELANIGNMIVQCEGIC
jgi:hypothetical protein